MSMNFDTTMEPARFPEDLHWFISSDGGESEIEKPDLKRKNISVMKIAWHNTEASLARFRSDAMVGVYDSFDRNKRYFHSKVSDSEVTDLILSMEDEEAMMNWFRGESSLSFEYPGNYRYTISKVIFPTGETVYVWYADPFLKEESMLFKLKAMKKAGINRMLLSFNASQVRLLDDETEKKAINYLLSEAEKEGVRVDLLLGDPSWILPEYRLSLVKLINLFSPFSFKGIHLDMEPDSLQGASSRREYLTAELIHTLELVSSRTSLPLSISIHPRYLEGILGDIMFKGLLPLNIEDIAVMIYSTKTQTVRARFDRIKQNYPALHLALAQSVEKALPAGESYFQAGKNALWRRVAYYDEVFSGSDYGGIFIQSWRDYEQMKQ